MSSRTLKHHRGFSKLDAAPEEVQLQVKDWAVQGVTYQEMEDRLREQGFEIGRQAIWSWIAKRRNETRRIESAKQKAEMLMRYLVPEGADVESGAIALAQAILMEALVDAQPLQVESIWDLCRVTNALGRVQTSKVSRERLELIRTKAIKETAANFRMKLMSEIETEPELLEGLIKLTNKVEAEMTSNQAA